MIHRSFSRYIPQYSVPAVPCIILTKTLTRVLGLVDTIEMENTLTIIEKINAKTMFEGHLFCKLTSF